MKRIFNSNNLIYTYPDGSGLETKEWQLRRDLLVDRAKTLGVEKKRIRHIEFAEINKLFEDIEKLQQSKSLTPKNMKKEKNSKMILAPRYIGKLLEIPVTGWGIAWRGRFWQFIFEKLLRFL